MRTIQTLLVCGAVALTAMAATMATPAEARVRVGVMIGVPGPWYPHPYYDYPPPYYYPPAYYPSAYYYRPPAVIVPQAPPTYIQQPSADQSAGAQSSAQDAESTANYWYYCAAEKGYYPYVKQCPSGWKRVAPKPGGAP